MSIGRIHGTVSKWIEEKGYGFITFDHNKSAFIHHSEIEPECKGKKQLVVGEQVEFCLQQNEKGFRAIDLIRL